MRTRLNDLFSYIQVLILSFFVNKTYTGQHILRFADRTYSRSFAPLRCETGCVFSGYQKFTQSTKNSQFITKNLPMLYMECFQR